MNAHTPAYPDDNPKTVFGVSKPGIQFVPASSLLFLGQAMQHGAQKYGPFNWRQKTVSSSVYYDAGFRHRAAFWDGDNFDAESGIHHLAHSMACDAIVLDAITTGMLNDDRPTPGNLQTLMAQLTRSIGEGR